MSAVCVDLAPRIRMYRCGSPAPAPQEGWLSLAQLSADEGISAVFGDGSHPTTRLCAGVLDVLCRQMGPESVLDVGTGTGVLARIARARGARFVVGTDIDPLALVCAEAHSALDAHEGRIHFSSEGPDHWGPRFDVVVANILEAPLKDLAAALRGALRPTGTLLISGFTRLQRPVLRVSFERDGLVFAGDAHLNDWALLRFSQPPGA